MKFSVKPSTESIQAIIHSADDVMKLEQDAFFSEYKKWHQKRLALDLDWILDRIKPESRVLEVGGFPFFLSISVLSRGYDIEVVDKMSSLAISLAAKKRLIVKPCDIETEPLPYGDNELDEVIFNEVFEHLRINPIFTLKEVMRVLKPGGRLWLSTPNMGSLKGIVNLIFRNEAWAVVGGGLYDQYSHLSEFGWMGHVREYTSKEVSDFLSAVGFKVTYVIYRGEYSNIFVKTASVGFPRFLPYFSLVATKPS
jgi:SAM-dependent methyltransferase